MDNLIIVGIGVNGKKAYEFIKRYNLYNIIGFSVNSEYYKKEFFCGLPVYKLEELKDSIQIKYKIFVALYWNKLNSDRKNLFEYCKKSGFEFANLISPHASIDDTVKLGKNCWINDFACIFNDTIIMDNVIVMPFVAIGEDCTIHSHTFVGASTCIGGQCIINEQSFTGFNATILESTIIGKKCIIGAGTVIKRNLPSFSRCIVSSHNQSVKQYKESEIETKLLFSKNVR